MKINIVRLDEFAWSKLETREGNYDFSWLDKVIDILYNRGIYCIIGTPTAAPPPWMTEKYPEILFTNSEGYRSSPGSRRYYCPNNPKYHEFTRRIVTKLAEHYKNNPAVVAWQIDLKGKYTELLSGTYMEGKRKMNPYQAIVIHWKELKCLGKVC